MIILSVSVWLPHERSLPGTLDWDEQQDFYLLVENQDCFEQVLFDSTEDICAEVQAVNMALWDRSDAQISDFVIATVGSKDKEPRMRCENCKVTLAEATVITDEMAEKEMW